MIEQAQQQTAVLHRFKNANLPVLPPGAPYLIRTLSDVEICMHEIADVMERFPSIAMRLLALANSAWSAPASPIHSLVMACARLGLDIVRSVSIALTVAAPFDPRRCPGFKPARYWTSALLAADAAHALATVLPYADETDPQAVRTAGLLHNIGLVWMASHMPRELEYALQQKQIQPELSLSQHLRNDAGLDYAAAGAFLGQEWRLPKSIVQSMQHHANDGYRDEEWQTVSLVRHARTMVSILLDGEEGERQVRKLEYLQTGEIGSLTSGVFEEMRGRVLRTQTLAQELFGSR